MLVILKPNFKKAIETRARSLVILVGPLQLRVFYDSMSPSIFLSHYQDSLSTLSNSVKASGLEHLLVICRTVRAVEQRGEHTLTCPCSSQTPGIDGCHP